MSLTVGTIKTVFTADTKQLVSAMNKADSALNKTIKKTKETGKSFKELSIAGKAAWGAMGAAAVYAVTRISKAAQEVETLSKRLEFVSGSTVKAAKDFAFLAKESERLGLDLAVTSQEFSKFIFSARGTMLEGEGVRNVFTAMSEAASVMRMDSTALKFSFKALNQMMDKTTIMSEELKLQLGDHLPGAVKIMAKAVGVSTKELMKMMERGLSTEMVLGKFASTLHDEVAPGLDAASNSLTAFANRTSTAWFLFKKKVLADGALINDMLKGMHITAAATLRAMNRLFAPNEINQGIMGSLGFQGKDTEDLEETTEAVVDTIDLLTRKAEELAEAFRKSFSGLEEGLDVVIAGGKGSVEALDVIRNQQLRKLESAYNAEIESYKDKEQLVAAVKEEYDNVKLKIDEAYGVKLNAQREATMQRNANLLMESLQKEEEMFQHKHANILAIASDSLETATDGLIDWMTGAEVSFKDMANSMIKDILRVIAQIHIIQPMMQSLTGSLQGGSSSGGGMYSTLGKVFGFADGGVITEPIAGVGMKSGSRYTFGEEGAEAITPLNKGAGKAENNFNISISALDSKSLTDLMRDNPQAVVSPFIDALQSGSSGLSTVLRGTI